nr:MAG TPA: hypothetical protein [Bacteriophage sp.]
MNRSEWERKVIDESYKLDQYLKKSPPVLSEELKQTYTKLLDECEKALRRFENEIRIHPFGGDSFLKSLCKDIERLILKIKDYLYLYRTWKPTPPAAPAPATKPIVPAPVAPPATNPIVPAPVAPPATKPIVPAPVAPPATKPIVPAPVAPSTTKPIVPAPVATPATKPIVPAPVTPATKKNEEEPKKGFFTPTNILLVLLVVGGGFFFLTRKEK